MNPHALALGDVQVKPDVEEPEELRLLFHRLNNQLAVILTHAELMETKASDESNRSRATRVVSSVLEAMSTTRDIRAHVSHDH